MKILCSVYLGVKYFLVFGAIKNNGQRRSFSISS